MMNRFKGQEGRELLIEELLKQSILRDDKKAVAVLAEKCTLAEYSARSSIFREGDASHNMLLILEGRVSVVVRGQEVAQRSSGQHVGEMALLDSSAPRSASIIAIENTITASISEPDFTELAEHDPKLWRLLAIELSEIVRKLNPHS